MSKAPITTGYPSGANLPPANALVTSSGAFAVSSSTAYIVGQ